MEPSKMFIFPLWIAGIAIISGCLSNQPGPEFDINKFIEENDNYNSCNPPVFCNNLVKVDCGADADGPLYYLDRNTGEKISGCGGLCMLPQGNQIGVCNTLCPPKEWDCR